jgi:hypothetical protein
MHFRKKYLKYDAKYKDLLTLEQIQPEKNTNIIEKPETNLWVGVKLNIEFSKEQFHYEVNNHVHYLDGFYDTNTKQYYYGMAQLEIVNFLIKFMLLFLVHKSNKKYFYY